MITAQTQRPLLPVHGTTRWLLTPTGQRPGILDIGGLVYLFEVLRCNGRPYGYRLSREADADGPAAEYQLPIDVSACDCADSVYRSARPGGCKHKRALSVAIAALGTDRMHAELSY